MAQININVKTFTGPTPPLTPDGGEAGCGTSAQ